MKIKENSSTNIFLMRIKTQKTTNFIYFLIKFHKKTHNKIMTRSILNSLTDIDKSLLFVVLLFTFIRL